MGDAREAEKNGLYADMAEACDMEFGAIVLYTYGGFHASALTFIRRMAKAVDPATCLTSPSRWRRELMEQMAIAVQRGNADIMITAAQRLRGKAWVRRRQLYSASRHSSEPSRSSGRGRWEARGGRGRAAEAEERRQHLLPDSGRAMACVARLLGLSDQEAACRGLGCPVVDSDAATEVEDEDGSPSSPSIIPETPPRRNSGQQTGEEVSTSQRGEKDCDENVCANAVGAHRDDAQNTCAMSAMVTAVAAVVLDGDGMEMEEVVGAVCDVVECGGVVMEGVGAV